MGFFNDLFASYKEARRKSKILTDTEKRFKLAIMYNSLYFKKFGDSTWMCPVCNRVHSPNGADGHNGNHFVRCCHFFNGHRNGKEFATSEKNIDFRLKEWFYK